MILSQQLARVVKVGVLFSLVITFGFFIQEVWVKFTEKSTNYMQSEIKVDSYISPTFTFCFKPTKKPSMRKHYNLSGMDFKNLALSNYSITSMTKMIEDSYYQYGRDFTLTVLNQYIVPPIKLHEGTENFFEFPQGTMNRVTVKKFLSYISGLCYAATILISQNPDRYLGLGLVLNDSLKEKNDEPNEVEIIITSATNVPGIVRGAWVEGDQFEMSLSLKDKGSILVNLREFKYYLLSSPPHCEQISHYECLGYGLQKVFETHKFCTSTSYEDYYENLCVNNCPKICLPIVFRSLMELAISNVNVPACETGEENYCMGVIMLEHLIELSKNCSPGCKITKYKGTESE